MKASAVLVTLMFISGCAAGIPVASERALSVQVHTQMSTLLDSCEKLGLVNAKGKSVSGWTLSSYDMAALVAENEAREAAADMGADSIALLQSDVVGLEGGTAVVQVQGIAFKCQ
jgi:hypothetical protein